MSDNAVTARRVAHPPADRPVLIYDGTCTFCLRWIERWRAAAGGRLDLVPAQTAAGHLPEIPAADFDRAVQWIDTSGLVSSAAGAFFRARALALRRTWLLAAYERVPGFAPAAEAVYRFVANHRPLLSWLTRILWGADVCRPTFGLSTWVFLRLLGAVHLVAFASFWSQLNGLIGPDGLLPAQRYFDALRAPLGAARYWELPTLCWLFGGSWFLHVLCGAGVALAAALIAGWAPAVCLGLLWADYLSLSAAGQVFLNYQWDALLLETTLLSLFLAPWSWRTWRVQADPRRLSRWLLWWLFARLMLLSGAVKLLSGDPTWRNLTALSYHFETQPLPTWIGWYAHQFPAWAKQASCGIMFAIELSAPLLLVLPRRARHLGAALQLGLQALIALTGNYTFFNLLAAALALLFIDDAFWRNRWKRIGRPRPERGAGAAARLVRWCPRPLLVPAAATAFGLTGIVTLATLFPAQRALQAATALPDALSPLRSFNRYGLFAVMTRERPEIVIEGSNDGRSWLPYEFKAKPGDLRRRPGFVAPLQPRLDWQLWFAALESPAENPWVTRLCVRLLQGSRPVLALFASNPFPDRPPREVRAVLYEYRFTNRATRAASGCWWDRTPVDFYVPPISLR
ncbi:MAG TPA: lipase maturation factor family protein [Opitutaceae bacterium]|nr:lipase maturation factor family protein [Opitutaceae bacterium]